MEVVIKPITLGDQQELLSSDGQARRLGEKLSNGTVGYVHRSRMTMKAFETFSDL